MGNQQESSHWKTITEFPTWEVNCLGVIRNVKNKRIKYTNKFHKGGYELVQFKKNNTTYMRKVHRIVAEHFLEPPETWLVDLCKNKGSGKVLINHKDGNKLNNDYKNLEWCDDLMNSQHAHENGLVHYLSGELNGRAILNDALVHQICKDFESGMQPLEAIEKYKISRSQATKIRSGHAWKHIWKKYRITVRARKSSTTSRKA